jgi:hypothetical protein
MKLLGPKGPRFLDCNHVVLTFFLFFCLFFAFLAFIHL